MYFHSRGGRLELLEPRNMLSGHALGMGISHAFRDFSAPAAAHSEARSEHSHGDDGGSANAATVLSATLSDPNSSATGTVTYQAGSRCGTTVTQFIVNVTGATADSTLDVAIDGAVVGQLTTDASGNGTLKLSSKDSTLPDNFPTSIAAGSVVTVGALSGTLATPTSSGDDSGDGDGGGCSHSHSSVTRLTAALADSASSATGTATYFTHTKHDGTTVTKFKITVTGAAANTTFDVAIDGTVVGQITTDDTGAGSLKLSSKAGTLPANFPAVNSGSVVTVGTITGTLSQPGASSSGSSVASSLRLARRR